VASRFKDGGVLGYESKKEELRTNEHSHKTVISQSQRLSTNQNPIYRIGAYRHRCIYTSTSYQTVRCLFMHKCLHSNHPGCVMVLVVIYNVDLIMVEYVLLSLYHWVAGSFVWYTLIEDIRNNRHVRKSSLKPP